MVPYYLKNHLINIKEKKNKTKAMLVSSTGNTNLEIYFYGELINFKRTPFIIDSEYPCLIVAKDPLTSEEFIVFDGAKHGYDAMFCNETIKNIERDKFAKIIDNELRLLDEEFKRYKDRWDKLYRSIETVSKDVKDIHTTTTKITKMYKKSLFFFKDFNSCSS